MRRIVASVWQIVAVQDALAAAGGSLWVARRPIDIDRPGRRNEPGARRRSGPTYQAPEPVREEPSAFRLPLLRAFMVCLTLLKKLVQIGFGLGKVGRCHRRSPESGMLASARLCRVS
jgi:hypothetical protein